MRAINVRVTKSFVFLTGNNAHQLRVKCSNGTGFVYPVVLVGGELVLGESKIPFLVWLPCCLRNCSGGVFLTRFVWAATLCSSSC